MKKPKIIGIIAVKGGVGKTTIASNLGATLSNDFNKKVLVIDGNFSAPNLGLHMGIANPEHTIHNILFDNLPIKSAIIDSGFGFDIIPGALLPTKKQQKKINPYKLTNRLEDIKHNYDFIIIDSSPNLNEEMLATILSSDNLFVVASPDYPTLSCTLRAIKTAKEKNTNISGLILNRVYNKQFELNHQEINSCTDIPIVATIKNDIRIAEALSKTTPAVLSSPKKATINEYKKLGGLITGEEIDKQHSQNPLKRAFNKFSSYLQKK